MSTEITVVTDPISDDLNVLIKQWAKCVCRQFDEIDHQSNFVKRLSYKPPYKHNSSWDYKVR